MNTELTRKDFLFSSAVGVSLLLLPTSVAYASEKDILSYAEKFVPYIPPSDDAEIAHMNQRAIEQWLSSVNQAQEESAGIYVNPDKEPQEGNYRAIVCSQEVAMWNIPCTILFSALYDVSTGGTIKNVYRVNSYAEKQGPIVSCKEAWFTRINSQRKLATFFLTKVTWEPGIYPERTETIATYAEFQTEGYITGLIEK